MHSREPPPGWGLGMKSFINTAVNCFVVSQLTEPMHPEIEYDF